MENHPIPQDVTGFQFKLIGNMTVKQFAYLLVGVVFAWVFYLFPFFFLIKFPLILICAGTGAALAFLPIEGRPLDVMVRNFFKAMANPTQYVYHKIGGHISIPDTLVQRQVAQKTSDATTLSGKKLQEFLQTLPQKSNNQLDEKEMLFFKKLSAAHADAQPLSTPQPMQQILQAAQTHLPQPVSQPTLQPVQQPVLAQPAPTPVQPAAQPALQPAPVPAQQTPNLSGQTPEPVQTVRQIPTSDQAKKAGLPIAPEAPNLITGIVKDSRGNPLQNVLIEIKDGAGNSVRAFKTNGLGQFASATALASGTYTITLEDPKAVHRFDPIECTLMGNIVNPIEIISTDMREELRKSLFGGAVN
ncbi:MAG TPA: PrgI family protein [Candidatus Saccharimonadales bacterium]|nr:PrgI family protein [Candidatus Saccharimonadales bacterium]